MKALIAIEHFSHGLTVRQISETLGVSERTIQRYIKNYNSLGMESLLKKKIPGRSKKWGIATTYQESC
ncbi:helix-turn-helix domain-containing protein [Paenibacillus amylolyticus]|uniref:helix-turn-helix domain-containing protein n=1 Tax=Paenibacillus amylolyticus TaxID=1451 RepID=UPI000B86F10A